eukprot:gene1362-1719_t
MTDVLNKSDSPNLSTFTSSTDIDINKQHDVNERKQKLVYTSDFLRKFDNKKDKHKEKEFHHSSIVGSGSSVGGISSQQQQQQQQSNNIGLPFNEQNQIFGGNEINLEKDRQIVDYKQIIQRLKGIIYNSKDENLINMMKVVLSENPHGKLFLNDDIKKGSSSDIQSFVYLGDVEPSQMSVTPLNSFFAAHASNNTVSGSLPPLRSPRKVEPVPVLPLSQPTSATNTNSTTTTTSPQAPLPQPQAPPQQPSQSSFKSPRRQPSTTSIFSTLNNSATTTTNNNNITSNTTPSSVTTTQSSLIPPGFQQQQQQQQQQTENNTTNSNIINSNNNNNLLSTVGGTMSTTVPPSSNLPPQPLSSSGGGTKMKKSPSMPVIAAKSSSSSVGLSTTNAGFAESLKKIGMGNINLLSSASSSTTPSSTIVSGNKPLLHSSAGQIPTGSASTTKRDVGDLISSTTIGGTPKRSTDNQPRKPMTKSVSMGAISDSSQNQGPIKNTSLEEISGQIYHLTKYQAGCRFLQKKLEENPDPAHVNLIFKEVFEHLIELMVDPYGQYLIPQLMKYCDNNQRRMIVDRIAPKIETFACHVYGIHGTQKILSFLSPDQIESIVSSIRDKVISLSKDNKGNYLIQSFLKQFSPEVNQFICDAIMENVQDICTHKVGCTVVNRCIDHSNPQQLALLVDRITDHSLDLVQDQFGNYVVQHLLSNNKSYSSKLIKSLLGNIAELSVQKFSSNVIEKCLQVADPETYESIIKEITEADILTLLQDKYANFVIQTALDVADENQHARLVKLIVPYIHQIKTPYVIHIQKKILQV